MINVVFGFAVLVPEYHLYADLVAFKGKESSAS
jgi:hypothetical protein